VRSRSTVGEPMPRNGRHRAALWLARTTTQARTITRPHALTRPHTLTRARTLTQARTMTGRTP
jgi:hypothetical protein